MPLPSGTLLLAFLTLQRLTELQIARRHTRALLACGAYECGAKHYHVMVALHATWLCSLWYFGWNHNVAPLFLGLFVMLQVGRLWVIRTLGERWTTRIIIVPSAAPVTSGPFRFVRHPNYLIVAAELPCVSLALGLGWHALLFGDSISPCWPGAFAPKTQRSSQPNASFYRAAFSAAARFASVNASRFA